MTERKRRKRKKYKDRAQEKESESGKERKRSQADQGGLKLEETPEKLEDRQYTSTNEKKNLLKNHLKRHAHLTSIHMTYLIIQCTRVSRFSPCLAQLTMQLFGRKGKKDMGVHGEGKIKKACYM